MSGRFWDWNADDADRADDRGSSLGSFCRDALDASNIKISHSTRQTHSMRLYIIRSYQNFGYNGLLHVCERQQLRTFNHPSVSL